MTRYVILLLLFCCPSLGCTQTSLATPIPVPVMGFCSDWDVVNNQPVGETTVFSVDAPRIYAFARVEAHREFYYTVNWLYEKGPQDHELVDRQVIQSEEGYVVTWIESMEGRRFRAGKYLVRLGSSKYTLCTAEFEVK